MCQDTEISSLRMFQFCLEQEIFEFKSTLFYLKTKHFFSPKEVIYSFHHFNYKSDRTPTENQARPGRNIWVNFKVINHNLISPKYKDMLMG